MAADSARGRDYVEVGRARRVDRSPPRVDGALTEYACDYEHEHDDSYEPKPPRRLRFGGSACGFPVHRTTSLRLDPKRAYPRLLPGSTERYPAEVDLEGGRDVRRRHRYHAATAASLTGVRGHGTGAS